MVIISCTVVKKFLTLTDERLKEIRRLKLCLNCLRNDHFMKTCKMETCRECSGDNTLCHHSTTDEKSQTVKVAKGQTVQATKDETSSNVIVHHAMKESTKRHVIMATVMVNATHLNGFVVSLRILLDNAWKDSWEDCKRRA